jgi:hypothetical protein
VSCRPAPRARPPACIALVQASLQAFVNNFTSGHRIIADVFAAAFAGTEARAA